jgi:hypothetical protein
LLGVAHQDRPADSVTVTCDTDRDDIRELLVAVSAEVELPLTLLRRPHKGDAYLNQVRNNAIRMLLERGVAGDSRLIILDGDTVARPDMVAKHLDLGRDGDLVIAFRVNLTPQQTDEFDEDAVLSGRPPITPTDEQLRELDRRHRKYRRQQRLRRFGLAKPHKPKPLGGHHSVTVSRCRAVNGFDEEYHGWGADDDDFGRRVYAGGGTSVVAVRDIIVFHQYHPTRAPGNWHDNPNAALFRQRRPARCVHGIESPVDQGEVEVISIEPRVPATRRP